MKLIHQSIHDTTQNWNGEEEKETTSRQVGETLVRTTEDKVKIKSDKTKRRSPDHNQAVIWTDRARG